MSTILRVSLLLLALLVALDLSCGRTLRLRRVRLRHHRFRRLRHGSFGFRHAVHQTPADYVPDYRRVSVEMIPAVQTEFVAAAGDDDARSSSPSSPSPPPPPPSPFPTKPFKPLVSALPSTPCKDERKCTEKDQKYRSMDGSCNNLDHPSSGQSQRPFVRLIPRKHSLVNCGSGRQGLPNPRLLSRVMIRRGEDGTSTAKSAMLWNFGQLVDHDIELTPPRQTEDGEFLDCCADENRESPDCCPIEAPKDDPFYGQKGRPTCMPFIRSLLTKRSSSSSKNCMRQKPDITNANTAWVDASFLYGSDDKRAMEMRELKGGLLKMQKDGRGREWPPMGPKEETDDPDDVKMELGDNRADVHPGQTMLNVAFHRNHNRIAREFARMHPNWDDEKLFQEARKLNAALYQHVVYTQFMDALLGTPNNVALTGRAGRHLPGMYDSRLDGGISVGFGTAGYRLHTYVSGHLHLRNINFVQHGSLRLRDIFHKPRLCMENDTYDDVTRGLSAQPLSRFDNVFTPEMTEWLFPEGDANFGLDIAALNVQRGRDHQIPAYPSYKKFCGLGPASTWHEMTDLISPTHVHRLVHTYEHPDDVDLYVGGNLEIPVRGSVLGPTFHCLVRDQFERLRNADRFFYTNPGQFTDRQLASIGRTTLSRILCDNADDPDMMSLPRDLFRLADSVRNPAISCTNERVHQKLDLGAWQ